MPLDQDRREDLEKKLKTSTQSQEREVVDFRKVTQEFPELLVVHTFQQNVDIAKQMNLRLALEKADLEAKQTLTDLLDAYEKGQAVEEKMEQVKREIVKLKEKQEADQAARVILERLADSYQREHSEKISATPNDPGEDVLN